jgi:GNAT superfamily N-acetyltransferase
VSLSVRPVVAVDIERLLELIDGLAEYEKLPRPDPAARRRLAADAIAEPPRFHALLAEIDGLAVGYAVYFFTYSTFLALPGWRGHGAGIGLFRACASQAVSLDCGRMEWQVLSWNTPSIEFYERLGARHLESWLPFRLDAEALARVVG